MIFMAYKGKSHVRKFSFYENFLKMPNSKNNNIKGVFFFATMSDARCPSCLVCSVELTNGKNTQKEIS